jgi:hypothetical protein
MRDSLRRFDVSLSGQHRAVSGRDRRACCAEPKSFGRFGILVRVGMEPEPSLSACASPALRGLVAAVARNPCALCWWEIVHGSRVNVNTEVCDPGVWPLAVATKIVGGARDGRGHNQGVDPKGFGSHGHKRRVHPVQVVFAL